MLKSLSINAYIFSVLDAVGFNCGAAHVEIMVTDEGPQLIEVNPRLVGAKIARLSSHGLGYSVHEALIRLHLGDPNYLPPRKHKPVVAVSRWIVAASSGLMEGLYLPDQSDSRIKEIDILAKMGDRVNLPYENADRLGVVMAAGDISDDIAQFLDKFIPIGFQKIDNFPFKNDFFPQVDIEAGTVVFEAPELV